VGAIADRGARYGIFEGARGCCGLPGDGSLHALRAEGVGHGYWTTARSRILDGRRVGAGFVERFRWSLLLR
jgi:hypothetical protein